MAPCGHFPLCVHREAPGVDVLLGAPAGGLWWYPRSVALLLPPLPPSIDLVIPLATDGLSSFQRPSWILGSEGGRPCVCRHLPCPWLSFRPPHSISSPAASSSCEPPPGATGWGRRVGRTRGNCPKPRPCTQPVFLELVPLSVAAASFLPGTFAPTAPGPRSQGCS